MPLLRDYLNSFPREACDYSICNLMTWGKIYNDQYLLWKDSLVIFNPKYHAICFPLGEGFDAADLRDLVLMFNREYRGSELILIPEDYQRDNTGLHELFEINSSSGWADYVYSTQKLVDLSGKKLAKKKNLISQFRRLYPEYKVVPINADHREYIIAFADKWKRQREVEGIFLQTELKALEYALMQWDELPIEGIIICHENKIAAFSIFSPQTSDMATIHYEKFDPEKKGSAQVINYESARYLLPRFQWINREQDLELEGLRQAKLSYLPDRMIAYYSGSLKAD